ncbi:MAG: ABC transporter permease [Flavobacteriales bacterium]|nr:ABC transporter permease [Flavobacteriales bacterium]
MIYNQKNIRIASEALFENKFRSGLTALGIIFGVAAVITMLAIGNGAQQQIIEQIEQVGAKNIIIRPKSIGNIEESGNEVTKKYSPKLSINDVAAIKNILPCIEKITPFVTYKTAAIANGKRKNCNLVGVSASYFSIYNLTLDKGSIFSELQEKKSDAVCLIGANLASKLFSGKNPIGKTLKTGSLQLSIIGIIAPGGNIGESLQNIGMNNYNDEIFIPINTALRRFKDRARITAKSLIPKDNDNDETPKVVDLGVTDQIEKIVIGITNTDYMSESVDILYRLLLRRHNGVEDFEIVVPEQILQQKKQTDDIFNILLGVIAAISLLVGGIGIMNIMLASVLERIKEIGLRMAIGAKKQDIKEQFVYEAGLISLFGGIVGILLGVFLSYLAQWITGTPTIISLWSVFISFFVSAFIGIVFGYIPAKKAAEQDPVNSLRQN